MPLSVVTPFSGLPLSLADAKLQLRITTTDDDTLITQLLSSAAANIESRARRVLLPTVFRLTLPEFDDIIWLPRGPLQSVDSFQYLDTDGETQTVPAELYHVINGQPDRIVLAADQTWPDTAEHPEAVTVQFTSGYENAAALPPQLVQAIRLEIEQQFEEHDANRERAIDCLCAGFRHHNQRAWPHLN